MSRLIFLILPYPSFFSTFETEHHNSSHRLKPRRKVETPSCIDTDYTGFMPGGYNYLDPNYMPAS